jgi:hypothetical protein
MFKSLKALVLVCVLFVGASVALAGDTNGPPAPGDTNGPPAPTSSTTSVTTSVVTTLILLVVG